MQVFLCKFSLIIPFIYDSNFLFAVGEGGAIKEHRTSFHAVARILRNEGFLGIYTGYV